MFIFYIIYILINYLGIGWHFKQLYRCIWWSLFESIWIVLFQNLGSFSRWAPGFLSFYPSMSSRLSNFLNKSASPSRNPSNHPINVPKVSPTNKILKQKSLQRRKKKLQEIKYFLSYNLRVKKLFYVIVRYFLSVFTIFLFEWNLWMWIKNLFFIILKIFYSFLYLSKSLHKAKTNKTLSSTQQSTPYLLLTKW